MRASLLKKTQGLSTRKGLPIVIASAVAGIVILVIAYAAGVYGAFEPENGTLGNGATLVSNSGASNGQAVKLTAPTPTPTPSATPTPTASPGVSACPAYPVFPDASCTGYAHTGVTLHACSSNLTQASYDSCLFTGEVTVSAANIHVTRSKVAGIVNFRTADDGSLRGLTLTDVEIDSSSYLGGASVGNNDYTCIRCHVHGGTRGANVGYNVTIQDSYLHGWTSQSGDHITGIGSNGGANNVISHNNISCDLLNDPTGYECSSGLSIYGDDPPGNNNWSVTNNLINSGSSYCMVVAGPPSKPYPFTNVTVTGNIFGYVGARYYHKPDSQCSEYGPINTNSGSWGVNGNVWNNNKDSTGGTVSP